MTTNTNKIKFSFKWDSKVLEIQFGKTLAFGYGSRILTFVHDSREFNLQEY